ncbi:hypothetical protein BKA57DRAFT_458986 [Linnemannia elongata]|nr:hypothetical protein BKA57DRAFT_458986 [Linnemannia elongata]
MGVFDIGCLTTDPESTTFYGFAFANSYDCPQIDGCTNHVLVKSNANPTSGSTLSWSLVSKISGRSLNMDLMSTENYHLSCAINTQGVFTTFGWVRDLSNNGGAVPFGVRYDPAGTMDAKYNFKGSGAWMNMAVDKAYNWTETIVQHKLGYVNNGGTTDLVHAMISGDDNKIYIAKVDEATKTLTATGTWALNNTIHGAVTSIGIGNNHLYAFGKFIPFTTFLCNGFFCLTGFPLTTISPTTPVGKMYNACQIVGDPLQSPKVVLYTYQNTLTLIAAPIGLGNNTIYKINSPDNANSTGPPVANITNFVDTDFFVPLGDGTSPTTFALMKHYDTMYVFGNDNGYRYTHEINKVDITDPVGINPNPTKPSTGSSSSQGDSSSAGAIVGAIIGVGFLVGLIVWYARRGETAKAAKATTTAADKPMQSFPPLNNMNNDVHPQQPDQPGGPSYYNPPGQYPAVTTSPSGQPAPTTIKPMAPITPVPQQHQTYQDQIQALQFSSHPRPTFVTTAAEEHETTAAAPAIGMPQSLWQPKPFVPPARPCDSTTTPSSPADTSRATITSTTANNTPAGTPLVLPRVPQVPYATRPQAPQHFGDQDVIAAGVAGYGAGYMPGPSPEMGGRGQPSSPHIVIQ